jgi:hypothetical protein
VNTPTATPKLTAVGIEDFVHAYLCWRKKPLTIGELASYIKKYAQRNTVEQGVSLLSRQGYVEIEGKRLHLTPSGRTAGAARYGVLDKKTTLENVVWPAMALGLDPTSKAAKRLSTPSILGAVLLAVLYELPLDAAKATSNQVIATLARRGLGGEIRLAATAEIKAFAQALDSIDEPQKLRPILIQLALQLNQPKMMEPTLSVTEFAQRVQGIVDQSSTPPLSDAVAISQVYDAYGRLYPDAGSLDSFKQRLLEANRAEHIYLLTLDRPEALPDDVRNRSQIQGRSRRRFHLIVRTSAL